MKYLILALGLLVAGAACTKKTVSTPIVVNTQNKNVSVLNVNSHTTGSFVTSPTNAQ